MDAAPPTKVLVVANQTAATPRLLKGVRERAKAGPCEFAVIVPGVRRRRVPNWTPETALLLLKRAALGRAEEAAHGSDAFRSVQGAVRDGNCDEIIVSVRPTRLSSWLRRDLIHRTQRLGVPVTAIVPRGGRLSTREAAAMTVQFGGSGPFAG
jgi:hypothetical protein